ncbi:MAG: NAD(P)H-binding protein [Candidatus Acidiferrales bacterium]
MNGCDTVVSSLGTGLSPFREVSLLTVATRALVTAMTRNGVRRLVCISALGVGGQPRPRRLRVRPAVRAFAAQPCLQGQGRSGSRDPRASSLDWVVVRPAMLTNDPARGSVRAVTDLAGVKGGKIARADVARFVVEQLTTDTWLRRTPVVLW